MRRSRAGPSSVQQQAGQTLMKQKSKRFLGTVIRRRMLVDATKGYGDELQYNVALRSPGYGREELSRAIGDLKALRQQLISASMPPANREPSFRAQESVLRPPAPTPRSAAVPPDHNANYLSTPVVNRSGTSKPPILTLGGRNVRPAAKSASTAPPRLVQSTSLARKAISDALSQSLNFKKFAQKSTFVPRSDGGQPDFLAPRSRVVPVNVQKNDLNRAISKKPQPSATASPTPPEKCKSSVYLTMSKQSGGNGMAPPATKISERKEAHQNGLRVAGDKGKPLSSAAAPFDGDLPSKFRVKKISIASKTDEQEPGAAQQKRNYVAGVKLYQPSPHSHVTINLELPVALRDKLVPGSDKAIANTLEKDVPTKKTEYISNDSPDFVQGRIFSPTRSQQPTKKTRFNVQNLPRVNIFEKRTRNRSSFPRDGAPHHLPSTKQNETSSSLNESTAKHALTSSSKKQTKNEEIPRFYFPKGKPRPKDELEVTVKKISGVCKCFENGMVPIEEMGLIAKACNLSLFWKGPLFHAATQDRNATGASEEELTSTWTRVTSANHDASSRFVALLAKPGKICLDFEDFLPLLKDIVDSHPGLIFLKDVPEFHTRYMNTVIARIFYVINRSWSGQITASELRKSNFLTVLSLLEEEDDINAVTDYFSYEHFYVIYCKFWELDTDHDLVIDKHDLMGYGDGVLSGRLIDRVLSGAVTRWDTSDHQLGKMSYVDFVWFILSEEDKKTPTSIEYWYRCMDLDGDGYISMYEMEYLYEEQSQKLEQLDIEPLPFEDCVCQIFDIVNPKYPGKVSLNDLKRCKMAHVFFDTFFNVAKYLNNEQKDPFVAQNGMDGMLATISDWDNFAAEEYEMLVAEEQSSKLTDLSTSLLEDEQIDISDNRDNENADNGTQLRHVKREDETAAKFADLNFVDVAKPDPLASLVQT